MRRITALHGSDAPSAPSMAPIPQTPPRCRLCVPAEPHVYNGSSIPFSCNPLNGGLTDAFDNKNRRIGFHLPVNYSSKERPCGFLNDFSYGAWYPEGARAPAPHHRQEGWLCGAWNKYRLPSPTKIKLFFTLWQIQSRNLRTH